MDVDVVGLVIWGDSLTWLTGERGGVDGEHSRAEIVHGRNNRGESLNLSSSSKSKLFSTNEKQTPLSRGQLTPL